MNYLTEYYKQQSILLEQEYKKLYSQYVYLNEMMDTSGGGGGGDEAGLGGIFRRIFGLDDTPKPRPNDPPNPHLRPHGRDGDIELPPSRRPIPPHNPNGGPPIATPGQKRPSGVPSGVNPGNKKPPNVHPNGTVIDQSTGNPNVWKMNDRYFFMDDQGIVYEYWPGSGMWHPNPITHPWQYIK